MGSRAGYRPLGVCRALPPPSPGSWGGGLYRPPNTSLAPLQGIQFLIENDLLKNTCEDIAQFLYKGEGLNKTAIGDYLGERCTGLWFPGCSGLLPPERSDTAALSWQSS